MTAANPHIVVLVKQVHDINEITIDPGTHRPRLGPTLALNTYDLPDDEARSAIDRAARETGLPATDPVRYDPAPVVDAIAAFHAARRR